LLGPRAAGDGRKRPGAGGNPGGGRRDPDRAGPGRGRRALPAHRARALRARGQPTAGGAVLRGLRDRGQRQRGGGAGRGDPAAARVRVSRFVSVMDVGRVLNRQTATSQIIGGVVWGIGMALLEHTAYDPRTGLPVNASFADYRIPVNADVGEIEVELVDEA